jgi:hypothetical protein
MEDKIVRIVLSLIGMVLIFWFLLVPGYLMMPNPDKAWLGAVNLSVGAILTMVTLMYIFKDYDDRYDT